MAKRKGRAKEAATPAAAADKKAAAFRDRIVRFDRVAPDQVVKNEKNWRTHPEAQRLALRGVLSEIGIAGVCLVRELPDGRLGLIDGELRTEEYTTAGAQVPVVVLDVTESEADKLLLTLDPLAAMAEADSRKLDELMREVETGTQELADMFTQLAEEHELSFTPSDDAGADEEEPEPKYFSVIVDCADAARQNALVERLRSEGLVCRRLTR